MNALREDVLLAERCRAITVHAESSGNGRTLGRDERLERFGGPHVFRVAPLIQIELLALDRVEPRARRPRSASVASSCSATAAFNLYSVSCAQLPRQPVGGPLRVRGFDPLARKRERAAGRRDRARANSCGNNCRAALRSAARRGTRADRCCDAASAGANSVSSVSDAIGDPAAAGRRAARRATCQPAHTTAAATISADSRINPVD